MENFFCFGMVIFMVSMLLFFSNFKHFLSFLIIVEFAMMGLVILLISMLVSGWLGSFTFLFFLMVMVCESVVGLGVLVALSRVSGGDMVLLNELMKW